MYFGEMLFEELVCYWLPTFVVKRFSTREFAAFIEMAVQISNIVFLDLLKKG